MAKRAPIGISCGTLAMIAVIAVSVAGQTPSPAARSTVAKPSVRPFSPARTPWGDPDLQGIYTDKDENGIPMERPGQFEGKRVEEVEDSELADIIRERQERAAANAAGIGGADTGAGPIHWYEHYNARNSRAWLIIDPPDGRIPPLTAAAQQRAAARVALRAGRGPADSYEDRSLYDRCITRGIPGSMMPAIYGNSFQIVQGPGVVAIRYEMIHEARIIPLDARPHTGKHIRQYMGDARGRFEGSTLVVETINFKPATAYRESNPDTVKLIERFTPIAPDRVEWRVTLNDADTWARPWSFALTLTKDSTQQVFEYACHEGNYGLRNILSAARAEEQAAAKSVTGR